MARVLAEAHRAAEGVDADQIAQLVDHFVRRFVVELGRVRAEHPHDVARELDRRALHAEADAEVGDFLFARIADRAQLPFDATRAEARADENAVDVRQLAVVALVFQCFGVDVDDAHLDVVSDTAVNQGFVERLVRIAELHIFADETDAHLVFGMPLFAHDLFPFAERAELLVRQMKFVEKDLVETFA